MLSVRDMKLRKIFRNPSENPRPFNDRVVHERIMTSKLLEPIQVGNLTFKNRIMFPPLQQDMKKEMALLVLVHWLFIKDLRKVDAPMLLLEMLQMQFVRVIQLQIIFKNDKAYAYVCMRFCFGSSRKTNISIIKL